MSDSWLMFLFTLHSLLLFSFTWHALSSFKFLMLSSVDWSCILLVSDQLNQVDLNKHSSLASCIIFFQSSSLLQSLWLILQVSSDCSWCLYLLLLLSDLHWIVFSLLQFLLSVLLFLWFVHLASELSLSWVCFSVQLLSFCRWWWFFCSISWVCSFLSECFASVH